MRPDNPVKVSVIVSESVSVMYPSWDFNQPQEPSGRNRLPPGQQTRGGVVTGRNCTGMSDMEWEEDEEEEEEEEEEEWEWEDEDAMAGMDEITKKMNQITTDRELWLIRTQATQMGEQEGMFYPQLSISIKNASKSDVWVAVCTEKHARMLRELGCNLIRSGVGANARWDVRSVGCQMRRMEPWQESKFEGIEGNKAYVWISETANFWIGPSTPYANVCVRTGSKKSLPPRKLGGLQNA
eukprot:763408-Hanusia_phi.AAC.2